MLVRPPCLVRSQVDLGLWTASEHCSKFEIMPGPLPELIQLDELQQAYIVMSTQDEGDASCFDERRRELLALPDIAAVLPEFVHRYRTPAQYWQFIKRKFPSYAERRDFIWSGFQTALDFAERKRGTPAGGTVKEGLANLDATHIQELWAKALARRSDDPEGAITAARTLLESVCN